MGDKETLGERVAALRLNPDAIERIEFPHSKEAAESSPSTKKSFQIYAHITTNDGYIGPNEAKIGLELYGHELRAETKENPDRHPGIARLERIVQEDRRERVNIIRKNSAMPLPEYLKKSLPAILREFQTPFHIYLQDPIEDNMDRLYNAFSWAPGFKNYFAVKALDNDSTLKVLRNKRSGADCSSFTELISAGERAEFKGEEMMLTSNHTPIECYKKARELGATINLDDLSDINRLTRNVGVPDTICFRLNFGDLDGNDIIGQQKEAKYGLTPDQIFEAYRIMKEKGVKIFGLHMMAVSNERNPERFIGNAKKLFGFAANISKQIGIKFDFINLGGGIGIPYKPEQLPVDLEYVAKGIKKEYEENIVANGLHPIKIFTENGRMITGPYGYLVTTVNHVEHKHKDYIGLNASSTASIMRIPMYMAYHHQVILGKENLPLDHIYDVVGPLCENVKFAINRPLPKVEVEDTHITYCTGAHGLTMCNNYNGWLKPGELLLSEKKQECRMIRRPETNDDYFATLNFKKKAMKL
jgi:diaminopimelate decarboxylase